MKKILLAVLALLGVWSTGETARASDLVAAVLPSSRSGTVNQPVTVFATLINTSAQDATGCTITTSQANLTLDFQATNPLTNQPVGQQNTPVSIAAGQAQSFVLTLVSSVTLQAVDVPLTFDCQGLQPAPIISGLDTLLLSIGTAEPADIIALSLTESHDGVVSTGSETGTGTFAVASIDIGAASAITVAPNLGDLTNLPVALTICQTNQGGACLATPSASVTVDYSKLTVASFAVFVTASGPVPFDPANTRVFVTFTDTSNVVRGKTSVALLVPATMTQTNVTPGGIYVGVMRITSSPALAQPVSAVISEDGEFHLLPGVAVTPPFGPIPRLTLQLTFTQTLTFTGTGNLYASGDDVTVETAAATATGIFSPRRTVVVSLQSGSETATIDLNFVSLLYDQTSSLAQLTGTRTLRDEAGKTLATIMVNADGSFSGMTAAGCMESGNFSIIDASFSVFRVTVNLAACGTTAAESFMGLASPISNIPGHQNDETLVIEASNPTLALANFLTPAMSQQSN
jgi:hypothetical protein